MARYGAMGEDHKERIRQSIRDRQAWVRETAELREAVDCDDERLARLYLRRIFIERRKEAAA